MFYGVDYGKRRVAVSCPERGWVRAYKVPESTPAREQHQLAVWVSSQVHIGHTLFVESPIGGAAGNLQTLASMAMVAGAIASHLADCRVELVAPSSWKKDVCGHGGLDKAGVAAWLRENRPDLWEQVPVSPRGKPDQDCIDAVCLGLYRGGLEGDGRVPGAGPSRVLRSVRRLADEQGGGAGGEERLLPVPGPA